MHPQSTSTRQQFVAICQCSPECMQPTLLAPRNDPRSGAVKRQPLAYILGHNRRVPLNQTARRKVMNRFQAVMVCRCGCGQPTLLADRTDATQGYVEGQPLPFIYGHHYRGEESHFWTGGRSISDQGYVLINVNGKQRLEHRVMWEAAYGPIPKGHEVHHTNECKADNRLDNFQLLTKAEHARLHARLKQEALAR